VIDSRKSQRTCRRTQGNLFDADQIGCRALDRTRTILEAWAGLMLDVFIEGPCRKGGPTERRRSSACSQYNVSRAILD